MARAPRRHTASNETFVPSRPVRHAILGTPPHTFPAIAGRGEAYTLAVVVVGAVGAVMGAGA